MLEYVPRWLGALLHDVRAGHAKLVIAGEHVASGTPSIALSSPAFAHGGRLPERFTADGEGLSPPLVWGPLPEATYSLALLVEDPDAPSFHPLLHALVWTLPPDTHSLGEAAFTAQEGAILKGWVPPDPPTGHGQHDYVFQLYALSAPSGLATPDVWAAPDQAAFAKAIQGRILAAGILVGTYSRGEEAPDGMPGVSLDPVLS